MNNCCSAARNGLEVGSLCVLSAWLSGLECGRLPAHL